VSATDWPLHWSFWVDHPLDAATVAGLLLVLITASIVEAYLRSREARRWSSVGRAAAAEFSHIFDQAVLAMVGLLGFETPRPREEIAAPLEGARARAVALLGASPGADPIGLLTRQRDPADPTDESWQQERLKVLMKDKDWVGRCHETLVAVGRLQLAVISRWVSAFAILNDDDHLVRMERALRLIEAERALDSSLLLSLDGQVGGRSDGPLQRWPALAAEWAREANHWYLRYQAEAEIPDLGPRRKEAERDRDFAIAEQAGRRHI